MSITSTHRVSARSRIRLAFELTAVIVAATALYVLFGYWRFGSIGPSGFFTTADELYVYEWVLSARQGHFPNTLPFGQLFHVVVFVLTTVFRLFVPDAMSFDNFTSTMRLCDALIWVGFACYSLILDVRRLWLSVILLNPVVIFMAFNYAKPDFLCFALAVLAFFHWIRYSRDDRASDLFAAAIFLGAALAAKASALLTIPFYPVAFWGARSGPQPKYPLSLARLSLAVLLVVLVTAVGSPRYLFVRTTIEGLLSESEITRFGFPGAMAYPGYYWLLILGLSFPVEIILSISDLTDRSRLRRTIVVGWVAFFIVFAGLVRHELPTHLFPLIAILAALGLDRELFVGHSSRTASALVLTAALLFSAVSLYPKLSLNMQFGTKTSYGRAASFLQKNGIRAVPLSEIVIGDVNLEMPAHFWRPDFLPQVLSPLYAPQPGYYLLSWDTYLKATVNSRRLDILGPQYVSAFQHFLNTYAHHSVFIEAHDLEADRLFYEIHGDGYWPWRYAVALIRREPIAPGPTIGVYRF